MENEGLLIRQVFFVDSNILITKLYFFEIMLQFCLLVHENN
jgi:hypothetical protein